MYNIFDTQIFFDLLVILIEFFGKHEIGAKKSVSLKLTVVKALPFSDWFHGVINVLHRIEKLKIVKWHKE
jgi:hypothetical protein